MNAVTKTQLGEIWSCLGNKGGVQQFHNAHRLEPLPDCLFRLSVG